MSQEAVGKDRTREAILASARIAELGVGAGIHPSLPKKKTCNSVTGWGEVVNQCGFSFLKKFRFKANLSKSHIAKYSVLGLHTSQLIEMETRDTY